MLNRRPNLLNRKQTQDNLKSFFEFKSQVLQRVNATIRGSSRHRRIHHPSTSFVLRLSRLTGGCIMEYWKHVPAFQPCK
ncbi:unnamed protein product [Lactuca virosa]|uniref:Uncharacterized protein n=1 Tax=Lactuca virosa TaxID=75947 RepID=A0AAU9PPK9_9ASTR|nr:unnamed protein product [Lactuca virosa]